MDFNKLKSEALKLKNKAVIAWKWAVDYSASKLADSGMTLKSVADLEKFIQKSVTTTGKDSATWKEKKFKHQVIVIFADIKSNFFKELLYKLPVLSTKAFSQNMALKAADISMKGLDSKKYQIWKKETLVVIENMKVIKTLEGEEKIQKVVKSLSLDINKSIEEL
jgi:hypothetical protein